MAARSSGDQPASAHLLAAAQHKTKGPLGPGFHRGISVFGACLACLACLAACLALCCQRAFA